MARLRYSLVLDKDVKKPTTTTATTTTTLTCIAAAAVALRLSLMVDRTCRKSSIDQSGLQTNHLRVRQERSPSCIWLRSIEKC